MDVGTDKPSAPDRARVPHHLLDVCDPRAVFTAADYQRLAREAVASIAARGRLPLLVGGSGLYIRAAVRDVRLPPAPPDPALRAQLSRLPARELHARLARVDPEAAARIEPGNRRRVVRALEIAQATGRPPSSFWTADPASSPYDLVYVVLTRPRQELYARIEARVRRELADGLADEVRRLLAAGVPPEAPSMQALGYKEVVPYVRGEVGRDAMVATLVRNTRRFAKRQLTWFRGEPGAWWLDLAELGERQALEALLRRLSGPPAPGPRP
jgi:tRNA dimethylallyltransferase